MRTSPRLVGAVCVAAIVVSGCSTDAGEVTPDPVSPTSSPTAAVTPTETESTPDDPFAMPDPVTEDYVDRVVNTLYAEWGAITREILETPADPSATLTEQMQARLSSIFVGPAFLSSMESARDALRGDRENLLPADEFGSVQWTTRAVFAASEECLVVAGDFDTSATATSGRSLLSALSLRPATGADENETDWVIMDSLANTGEDGEVLDDAVMLEASLDDFDGFLELTCEHAGGDQ